MAQIHVVGYVASDLELRKSTKGNPYVRFGLDEPIDYGRIQRYQVWAYGWDAEHLIQWKVRTGSLLEVNGPLILEEYTRKDGVTRDKRLKITFKDGGPLPRGKAPAKPAAPVAPSGALPPGSSIDGGREPLPE